ncbi:MAG: signal peptidase II [Acidimicrobiia bacterium]
MATRGAGYARSADLRIATIAVGVMAADLMVKWWATTVAVDGDHGHIVHTTNYGLAFGVANPPFVATVALVAAVTGLVAALTWRCVRIGDLEPWAAGALIGGAVGNLVDRLLSGGVHDFLRVGRLAMNVADVMILVGFVGIAMAAARARAARRCAAH